MTLKKIIAVLTVIAATALGGLIFSAHAVRYVCDSLNRLTEAHFVDNSWIQYTYDAAGNMTSKTYHGSFQITVISGTRYGGHSSIVPTAYGSAIAMTEDTGQIVNRVLLLDRTMNGRG